MNLIIFDFQEKENFFMLDTVKNFDLKVEK